MKTLLSLLLSCYLILVTYTSLNAQWVTIPDVFFIQWLNDNGYSQCMNGNQMDTTCLAIVNATQVNCRSSVKDLSGIQYFDNLKELNCSGNSLDSLPPLPAGLTTLDCSQNDLTSLPSLPSTLNYLSCGANQLTGFSSLPQGLITLSCGDNQLISLPPLPPNLTFLACGENSLVSLPVLSQNLKVFDCHNNQLTSLPSLPQSLVELICDNNQLSSLPALPPGLESLWCAYNQLGSLPPLPNSIIYLYCEYNQLTSLPELPDSLEIFTVYNNPTLTCLPMLKRIVNFQFQQTAVNCLPNRGHVTQSIPPINSLPICDTVNTNGCEVFWKISGRIISEAGAPIAGATVTLSGDDSQSTTTDNNGFYGFTAEPGGSYAITPSKVNDIITTNGITSVDMLLTRRHLLGTPLNTAYKIIAADVNMSNSVTTADILLMRAMILQSNTTFPNGRLWSFVPADYIFPNQLNPFPFPTTRTYTNLQQSITGQDFIGIKLGDVNDSWDATIP